MAGSAPTAVRTSANVSPGPAGVDRVALVGEGRQEFGQPGRGRRSRAPARQTPAVLQPIGEQHGRPGLPGDEPDARIGAGRQAPLLQRHDRVDQVPLVVDQHGTGRPQRRPGRPPRRGERSGVGTGEVADVGAPDDQGDDGHVSGEPLDGLDEARARR